VSGGPRPATPAWLLRPEAGLCPCGRSGRRTRGSYVVRTLEGGTRLLRHALFAEDLAARDGLLQRVEAPAKLAGIGALVVAAALVHTPMVLGVLVLLALALAAASHVPLRSFVARAWLAVPAATALIALPATLNLVTPGRDVLPLGSWAGHHVAVTGAGLTTAARLVLRVAASTSLVLLLTLTTPWTSLLAALRSWRVPKLFVAVLAIAHRYLFHLLGSVTEMFTARRARAAGPEDGRAGRAFVAASAGALLGRAHALSEEVHQAMLARGWSGEVRVLRAARVRALDVAMAACGLVLAAGVVGLDRGL
jgi:cobalt ECF transporter T component CbiQ